MYDHLFYIHLFIYLNACMLQQQTSQQYRPVAFLLLRKCTCEHIFLRTQKCNVKVYKYVVLLSNRYICFTELYLTFYFYKSYIKHLVQTFYLHYLCVHIK